MHALHPAQSARQRSVSRLRSDWARQRRGESFVDRSYGRSIALMDASAGPLAEYSRKCMRAVAHFGLIIMDFQIPASKVK
jgi:hypothetical protein